MIFSKLITSGALAFALASCTTVSHSPTPDTGIVAPAAYKYRGALAGSYRADWWRNFGDSRLNALQSQLVANNKDLGIAFASYQAALGAAGVSRAALLPRADGSATASRVRDSENNIFPINNNPYTTYQVGAQLGYEVDLWGRVRQSVRAANADVEAASYLWGEAIVSLQAQLARSYFALRFIDAEIAILETAAATRKESLALAQDRLDAGLTDALDVARAQGLLATAEADAIALSAERSRLENSIAVLVGKNASSFSIARRSQFSSLPPRVPAGLPAELMTRRPDIAAAYASLEASSARLGVAKAAPYPSLRLTGTGGLFSVDESSFLNASSRAFNIGPSVEFPIFAGGRLRGNITRAKANQAADLARFQQLSLTAFAEVETALASISSRRRELVQRDRAATAAREGQSLARLRYDEGTDTYLTVIDNERDRLAAERAAIRTRGQLYAATIDLIQALGGGFTRGK